VSTNGDPSPLLRVGLVGAGPWARFVHAPMLAGHPGTILSAVWARRPGAAQSLAAANGTVAVTTLDALFDACDAVAFAVPPDVQAELAIRAARAGKPMLLEKPLALDLAMAERLTDAIGEAGVTSQLVLTWRYTGAVRAFLAEIAGGPPPIGGRGQFVSGSALAGPFATPWRRDFGGLFDLGPHVIDTLDAALGPVVDVRATGSAPRWATLLLEHGSGVSSSVTLSAHSAVEPTRADAEIYTEAGMVDVDASNSVGPETIRTIADEFVRTATGTPHPLDAARGLHLQRILDRAVKDLGRNR